MLKSVKKKLGSLSTTTEDNDGNDPRSGAPAEPGNRQTLSAISSRTFAHLGRESGAHSSHENNDVNADGNGIDESEKTPLANSQNYLRSAIQQFETNYLKFVRNHKEFVTIQDDFYSAMQLARQESNIYRSAEIFRREISNVLTIRSQKEMASKRKVMSRVGHFLGKLYPAANISLRIVGSVGEVPGLKAVADGLSIILQLLDNESGRGQDFIEHLELSEYQATRIENSNFDLTSDRSVEMFREKAVNLLTGIVEFFNCALSYFSHGFSLNVAKTLAQGVSQYETGKRKLMTAIRMYDQSLMDLTVSLLAGKLMEVNLQKREEKDLQVLNWLSPRSHWLVDAQLHGRMMDIQEERSLQWAIEMDEFKKWRTSEYNSRERVLWIRGGPGMGKSTLSAYLVQVLKHAYPSSIVSYFFCRSGQVGLTQPRDVIRTIAYHFAAHNMELRAKMEALKMNGFPIDGTLGINFMAKKLIQEPLESWSGESFVVLDGLDEADMTVKDAITTKPEIQCLISFLGEVAKIRLLLVSRPIVNVQQLIPGCTVREIEPRDNADAIKDYISKALSQNSKLERRFHDAKIEPVPYFSENSKGMFLWVKLALQQLSDIRSKSAFCQSLKSFSHATGSLSELYLKIISNIRTEDRIWIKEILQWILVCQKPFFIKELRAAIEHSLDDELDDFDHFIAVECGSFLRCQSHNIWSGYTESKGEPIVEFVHDTFRSFIMSPNICPPDILIKETHAHSRVAAMCLRLAGSDKTTAANGFDKYAMWIWTEHLQMAETSGPLAHDLLISLYSFFTTGGLHCWVERALASSYAIHGYVPSTTSVKDIEEPKLEHIKRWLEALDTDVNGNTENNVILQDSLIWRNRVLRNSSVLAECIGKVAAQSWLNGRVNSAKELEGCFCLAMKYYWRRKERTQTNREEIRELTATKFKGVADWANCEILAGKKQLQVAFKSLKQWNDCLTNCEIESCHTDQESDLEFWMNVAKAYHAVGNYCQEIAIYKRILAMFPNEINVHSMLWKAYGATGDAEKQIESLWKTMEPRDEFIFFSDRWGQTSSRNLWLHSELQKAYETIGDYERMVQDYQTAVTNNPSDKELRRRFAGICESLGEHERLISFITVQYNENPANGGLLEDLAEAYEKMGDFTKAVATYQAALDKWPEDMELWEKLSNLYRFIGDFEAAVQAATHVYRFKMEKDPKDTIRLQPLDHVFHDKGNNVERINLYTRAVAKSPSTSHLWWHVADCYMRCGDYSNAIRTYKKALSIKGNEECHLIWEGLTHAYEAAGDCNAALDACEKGIKIERQPQLVKDFHRLGTWMGQFDRMIALYTFVLANEQDSEIENLLYDACKAKKDLTAFANYFEKQITSAETLDEKINIYDRFGKIYITKEDWNGAIFVYNAAIKSDPSVYWLHMQLGSVYSSMQDYDEAIRKYEIAVQLHPLDNGERDLWQQLAEAHLAKGEYVKAKDIYETALRNQSVDDQQVWYLGLGKVFRAMGDHVGAIKVYREGINKAPNAMSQVWESLGDTYEETKDWDYAIQAYKTAITTNRWADDSKLWNKLRKVHAAKGDSDGWRRDYEEEMERHRLGFRFWIRRLDEDYVMKGDFEGLAKLYQAALTKTPYVWELWCSLGDIYVKDQNYPKAVEGYQRAVQLIPDSSASWIRLGKTYELSNNYPEAIETYKKGIKRIPTDSWLIRHLGDAYNSTGQYDEAIQLLRNAILNYSSYTQLWDGLACTYAHKGECEKSIETYKEAIAKNPALPWLWFGLGNIYKATNDLQNAVKAYEMAIRAPPPDSSFLCSLINTQLVGSDFDFHLNDDIVAMFPWVHLTEVHEAMGNHSQAIKVYEEVVQIYKIAVEKNERNNLLWRYDTYPLLRGESWDTFYRTDLPKQILFAILGEAFYRKGDGEAAVHVFQKINSEAAWVQARIAAAQR